MKTPAAEPRTTAAIQARRRATQDKLQRVKDALEQLRKEKTAISYPAVVRRARVSRTFLYDNPEAQKLMATAVGQLSAHRQHEQSDADRQAKASWRERALNAEDALKTAHNEIRTQRNRIGQLLGQIRDLEHQRPDDQTPLIEENTTLKRRVHQLGTQTRELTEKLQAARSNVRFADRRISQLEAELVEHTTSQAPKPTPNVTDM